MTPSGKQHTTSSVFYHLSTCFCLVPGTCVALAIIWTDWHGSANNICIFVRIQNKRFTLNATLGIDQSSQSSPETGSYKPIQVSILWSIFFTFLPFLFFKALAGGQSRVLHIKLFTLIYLSLATCLIWPQNQQQEHLSFLEVKMRPLHSHRATSGVSEEL